MDHRAGMVEVLVRSSAAPSSIMDFRPAIRLRYSAGVTGDGPPRNENIRVRHVDAIVRQQIFDRHAERRAGHPKPQHRPIGFVRPREHWREPSAAAASSRPTCNGERIPAADSERRRYRPRSRPASPNSDRAGSMRTSTVFHRDRVKADRCLSGIGLFTSANTQRTFCVPRFGLLQYRTARPDCFRSSRAPPAPAATSLATRIPRSNTAIERTRAGGTAPASENSIATRRRMRFSSHCRPMQPMPFERRELA